MKKPNQIIVKSIVILLVVSTIITGLFSLGLAKAAIQINPQVTDMIQVTIETVDATGNHLDGSFLGANGIIGGTFEWVSTPHTLTIQNGGGTSYIVATWGGLTCYPGMSQVNEDVTYWYNARTSQVTQQSTPGTTKINIVFEPMQVAIDTVDPHGNHLSGLTSGAAGSIGGMYSWVNTPHELTLANGGGTSYLVVSWGGLVAYPGMSAVSKDTTYWFDALTSKITAQNTPDVCKINVVFEPIQVTLDAVNSAGTHLSGSTFSVRDYVSLNPDVNGPYVFTMANGGGSSSLTAAWGEIVFYTDIPTVIKDKTYWFDAITSQLQTDITPGDCKINVVFLPANPLTVVPEYPLGALIALAACFVGFVVFKKHSCLPKLKRTP